MIDMDLLQTFLGQKEVLVVDRNSVTRNRLVKMLKEWGISSEKIVTAGTVVEGKELIVKRNFALYFSDYLIEGGSAFDLFSFLKEKDHDPQDFCFLVFSSVVSQLTVGLAAENEVDAFIMRPFDKEVLEENLSVALSLKLSPSPYLLKIQEGRELIEKGEFKKSKEILLEALKLHPKPSLALSLLGELEVRVNPELGEKNFSEALEFNDIHFRSLTGLYNAYLKAGNFTKAYELVKKIASLYPASNERLCDFIHLAVRTGEFKDMEFFQSVYLQLDRPSETVKKHLSAGLYIAGKNCLLEDNPSLALKFFQLLSTTFPETPVLKLVGELLWEKGLKDEARRFSSPPAQAV